MKKALNIITLLAIANTAQAFDWVVGGYDPGMMKSIAGYGASSSFNAYPTGADLDASARINTVALNFDGRGIIAGSDMNGGYIGAVNVLEGSLVKVPLADPNRIIFDRSAINRKSRAIVGGSHRVGGEFSVTTPRAFLVSESLVLTELMFPSGQGRVSGVDINEESYSIVSVAKIGSSSPYVAFYDPAGTATDISSSLISMGVITDVAINDERVGFVGGRDLDSGAAYAAFVNEAGLLMTLPTGVDSLPSSGGISAVEFRKKKGMLVGQDGTNGQFYASYAYETGEVVNIPQSGDSFPPVTDGNALLTASLNELGAGLVGGYTTYSSTDFLYAGLVSSDGELKNLSLKGKEGRITTSSLTDTGVGIIGGYEFDMVQKPYVALIAPNGAVTQIPNTGGDGSLPSEGQILSVAIAEEIAASVAPQFCGFSQGSMFSLLALSTFCETHAPFHHKSFVDLRGSKKNLANSEFGLLADTHEEVLAEMPKKADASSFSVWLAPFGSYIHQDAQKDLPSVNNTIGGALLCLDYYQNANTTFGGGLGYAYDYVHFSQGLGHSNINEEVGVLYASFDRGVAYVNVAVWGGFYQLSNKRNTLGFITSKSSTQGYLLMPHLEIAFTPYKTWFVVEPFAMIDWANSWQEHFTESGASGLNLVMPGYHSSMLRTEAGLRLYEIISYSWGKFLIQEKGSYVNQTPFNPSITTFFVGSPTSFAIASGGSKMQNLAVGQLHLAFLPYNDSYPFGALDFQVEWSPSYQSYYAGVEIGKKF
jgi:hypothetical protein